MNYDYLDCCWKVIFGVVNLYIIDDKPKNKILITWRLQQIKYKKDMVKRKNAATQTGPSEDVGKGLFLGIFFLLRIPWYEKIIEQIGNWNFHPLPLPNLNLAKSKTQSKSTKDPTQDRVEHTNQ